MKKSRSLPVTEAPAALAAAPVADDAASDRSPRPVIAAREKSSPTMQELVELVIARGGSDLHVEAESRPRIRVDGTLVETPHKVLDAEEARALVYSILTDEQLTKLERSKEMDFAYGSIASARFRCNVFTQRGSVGAALRLIRAKIPSFEDLGLPRDLCTDLCMRPQGLILVTGATGTGKTTTLASMIDFINRHRDGHIVTIEDPIEYLHPNHRCMVAQREVGSDTDSFAQALRSALRQDPDIVLIGEVRDIDTVESALRISETGHLTFATLHTSDVVQTVNRIIDMFPSQQQRQARVQLSFTLEAVLCQKLLPKKHGHGRVLAQEILLATPAVRALIRDDKLHELYSVIQTGGKLGMTTMDATLARLVRKGLISREVAMAASHNPGDLQSNIG